VPSIAVVDDKELLRDSLAECLGRKGHEVSTFGSAVDAVETVSASRFDLVITDLKMPEMDGVAFLGELRKRAIDVPVILMTAYGSVPTAVEAMRYGAFDYVQKPFEGEKLILLAERAIAHGKLRLENEALRRTLSDDRWDSKLVGESPVMQSVLKQIALVAASDSTVLIQGESGTGKELAARAIHCQSDRAEQPMLCLNCPALSESLLESELFGHEKGAFTGADRMRKGRFELADGGTLLLDEVSEISLRLQGKLLRVLQEQEFERVGSSTTLRVNARVIATTNRDLKQWVAKGRFREDLYYRLSVLPIYLPPLRDREEDIESLANSFFQQFSQQQGVEVKTFSPDAATMMREYQWPGNVRELENLIERLCVLHRSDALLTAADLTPWFDQTDRSRKPTPDSEVRSGHLLADMEREVIENTLRRHRGHRQKTARELGIGVRTLSMKLKRWNEAASAATQA
jgi:DNA-binding NtrC family response regulator